MAIKLFAQENEQVLLLNLIHWFMSHFFFICQYSFWFFFSQNTEFQGSEPSTSWLPKSLICFSKINN